MLLGRTAPVGVLEVILVYFLVYLISVCERLLLLLTKIVG